MSINSLFLIDVEKWLTDICDELVRSHEGIKLWEGKITVTNTSCIAFFTFGVKHEKIGSINVKLVGASYIDTILQLNNLFEHMDSFNKAEKDYLEKSQFHFPEFRVD